MRLPSWEEIQKEFDDGIVENLGSEYLEAVSVITARALLKDFYIYFTGEELE
jgi:hypothetical protein